MSSSSSSSPRVVRWGIMGAAGIAKKNMPSLQALPEARVVAVASRGLDRAQAFADQFGIPRALGSYEELLALEEVDAVYIPLPTGVRAAWAVKAARAGKHILCEKPAARNAAEVAEVVAAAREAGVHYMDGVSFMHNPRLPRWRAALDDADTFGEVARVTSAFSFVAAGAFREQNIRLSAEMEPLGCLGDLGWYNVRVSMWAFAYARPVAVQARFHNVESVVTDASGTIEFPNGRVSELHCSFDHAGRQTLEVLGRRSRLAADDFVHGHLHQHTLGVGAAAETVRDPETQRNQVEHMYENFGRLILDAVPVTAEEALFWPRVAYTTQCVVDALVASHRNGGARTEVAYDDKNLTL